MCHRSDPHQNTHTHTLNLPDRNLPPTVTTNIPTTILCPFPTARDCLSALRSHLPKDFKQEIEKAMGDDPADASTASSPAKEPAVTANGDAGKTDAAAADGDAVASEKTNGGVSNGGVSNGANGDVTSPTKSQTGAEADDATVGDASGGAGGDADESKSEADANEKSASDTDDEKPSIKP